MAYWSHFGNSSCSTKANKYTATSQLLNILCASRENHRTQKTVHKWNKLKQIQRS